MLIYACVRAVCPSAACAGVSSACWSSMPLSSFIGISQQCSQQIAPATLAALSLQQVVALPELSYLTGPQLVALWAAHGSPLADAWGLRTNDPLFNDALAYLATAIDTGTAPLSEEWDYQTDVSHFSALHLVTCPIGCTAVLFASQQSVRSLPAGSWAGLRASQLSSVGPSVPQPLIMMPPPSRRMLSVAHSDDDYAQDVGTLAWLVEPTAWQAWQAAVMGSISAHQLSDVTPYVFAMDGFLSRLSPAVLSSGMTDTQMDSVSEAEYARLSCAAFKQLSSAQEWFLAGKYAATAAQLTRQCANWTLQTDAASSSTGAVEHCRTTEVTDSAIPTVLPSSSSSSSDLSAGVIAAIVLSVLAIAAVMIACVCMWRRMGSDKQTQPILDPTRTAVDTHTYV